MTFPINGSFSITTYVLGKGWKIEEFPGKESRIWTKKLHYFNVEKNQKQSNVKLITTTTKIKT